MSHIWVILSEQFYLPMFIQDIVDLEVIIPYIFAVQMSMVLPQKLRLYKRSAHPKRFVTNITKFISRFMKTLISTLIILEEPLLKNTKRLSKRSFWIVSKMDSSNSKAWTNCFVMDVTDFWLIDLSRELVLIVNQKRQLVINVMIVRRLLKLLS